MVVVFPIKADIDNGILFGILQCFDLAQHKSAIRKRIEKGPRFHKSLNFSIRNASTALSTGLKSALF